MSHLPPYSILLFKSVNVTMWADKELKQRSIPHKLVPMPRHISHDCGICIRIDSGLANHVRTELGPMFEDMKIVPLAES